MLYKLRFFLSCSLIFLFYLYIYLSIFCAAAADGFATDVRVSGCTQSPCILKKGGSVSIEVDFVTSKFKKMYYKKYSLFYQFDHPHKI